MKELKYFDRRRMIGFCFVTAKISLLIQVFAKVSWREKEWTSWEKIRNFKRDSPTRF